MSKRREKREEGGGKREDGRGKREERRKKKRVQDVPFKLTERVELV